MPFKFYSNAISQASRNIASGIFIVGLILFGFGLMIFLLPKLFATLAAIIFFAAGAVCTGTALKIFLSTRQMDKTTRNAEKAYRKNVRIHSDEYYDI